MLCLAIVAAGTGFGSTASAALPADSVLRPPDPGLVHRWAAFNQVPPNFSPAQAAAAAPSFDLATVKLKPSTPAVIAAMRSANPQLKVLVYHNGAFAQKNEGTKYPAAWYARDANGNKVVQTVFGNYLMDVSHPEWVAEVVRQCRSAKATTGADGCYTDMLMTAPLFENYANGGKPINPATGQVWTFPDFQVAVERIADAVRNGVPGPYGANGVARGKRWFASAGASSKTLTNHVDVAHSEIWLRDRGLSASQWPSQADWKLDVDMVVNAEAEGRVVMVETKLWQSASPALVDRWRAFALASFLLGTEGRSTWFLFTPAQTFAGMTVAHPWDDVPVGAPLGPYSRQGGGTGPYVRTFAAGFVAVNPGGSTVTVSLPAGTWRNLQGQSQSGSVPLLARTASIWVPVGAAATTEAHADPSHHPYPQHPGPDHGGRSGADADPHPSAHDRGPATHGQRRGRWRHGGSLRRRASADHRHRHPRAGPARLRRGRRSDERHGPRARGGTQPGSPRRP